MAELLVFTVDKIGGDVYKNAKLPKRGDVISVQADGWPWGKEELRDPRFLVVKVPGATVNELSALLSQELATISATHPSDTVWAYLTNTLQFRGFHLNLDALKASVRIPNAAALLAFRTKRPPIDNPAVIGPPTNVIG